MRELAVWAAQTHLPERPWLILGKGPTFARRHEFPLQDYNLLSLNHVVREQRVDIAHIIDVDVVEAVGDALLENCSVLLMPRVPHVQSRASLRRLEDFVAALPVLRELDASDRLVWYDAESAPRHGDGPAIEVRYFSSEAALSILGTMGVRTVRTLGIDGGQSYSAQFSAVDAKSRLANGQPSFDLQFQELDRIARKWQIDLQPLVEPVKVFVGADETQAVAARVLEHSIRTTTSAPVRFTAISGADLPMPKRRENRPRTGFSFARFAIPALCSHRGRAIYLDSDMQVFSDISLLWEHPMDGRAVLCTTQGDAPQAWIDNRWFHPGPQMSVLLMDCSQLDWHLETIVQDLDHDRFSYGDLLFSLAIVPTEKLGTDLPPEWNHLERHEPGVTNLTHYTVVPTQPWRADGNPLEPLWMDAFRSASAAGLIPRAELAEHVARGWVKQQLLDELDRTPPGAEAPPADKTVAELELAAAWDRIDDLHARDPIWRVRRALGRAMPLVRRTRGRGALGRAVEAAADAARRRLR